MTRQKIYLNCCFLFFFIPLGYSQESPISEEHIKPSNKLIFGVGGAYATLQDDGISPLVYAGIGAATQLTYFRNSEKAISQANVRFQFNIAESAISGAEIYAYQTVGAYQYFPKLWQFATGRVSWIPGLGADFNWNYRDHTSYTNNSLHIDFRASIAPAIYGNYDFSLLKRDFKLGMVLQLPLFTYVNRPLFASTRFSNTINKDTPAWYDYLSGGDIVFPNNYFGFSAQTFLDYQFKNGNGLRLDYYWSYSKYEAINNIRNASHALVLSIIVKL